MSNKVEQRFGILVISASWCEVQFPIFQGLVQGTGDQSFTVRGESDRINRISMTAKTFEEVTGSDIPKTNDAIERTSSYEATIRGNGYRCHSGIVAFAIHNGKHLVLSGIHIPYSGRAVATAGYNKTSVLREIEGVDLLFMSFKVALDDAL